MNRSFKYHEPDLYGDGTYSCLLLERDPEEREWKVLGRTDRFRTQLAAIGAAREWRRRMESSEF